MTLLQKKFATSFATSTTGQYSAVQSAVFKGRQAVLQQFLRRSLDPPTSVLHDILSIAALEGQNSMVTMLLDKGLDIDGESRFGTPLRAASLMGHESTVRILIHRGANVNTHNSLGDAMQASSTKGHISITRLLIQEGADVKNQGGYYGNALQAAALHGHLKVVELLLDAGAQVHQQGFCRDAFHAAAQRGQEGVVQQLLRRGFRFYQEAPQETCMADMLSPSPYKNLLQDASPSRIKDSAAGPEPTNLSERASTSDYHTIAHALSMKDRNISEDIQPYPKPNKYDHRQDYALQAAASKDHASVVGLILGNWNSVGVSADEAGDGLREASTNGHEQAVKCFVSSKLDLMPYLKPALEGAANHGHLTIVDMLWVYEKSCAES